MSWRKADSSAAQPSLVAAPQKRSFLASLFGRDKDAEEADDNATARETAAAPRGVSAKAEPASLSPASPPLPARVQLASAAEPVVTVQPVPLPPRRPIYQIAAAESRPAPAARSAAPQPAPVQLASLSPNEIVNMRGLWDSRRGRAGEDAGRRNQCAERIERAPHPDRFGRPRDHRQHRPVPATQDRVPADIALAYAAQADSAADPADRAPAVVTSKGSASIASKPSEAIAQSRLTQAAERLDDPWLRGLVLAPSVQNSLVVTQVGDPDFAATQS